jgi:hypothetical protein
MFTSIQEQNELAIRKSIAVDANCMILSLRNAIARLEDCRTQALHSNDVLRPVLGDVADLCNDSTRLVAALAVAIDGAAEKLGA